MKKITLSFVLFSVGLVLILGGFMLEIPEPGKRMMIAGLGLLLFSLLVCGDDKQETEGS